MTMSTNLRWMPSRSGGAATRRTERGSRWLAIAALCCVGLAGAGTARAEGEDIQVQLVPKVPDPNNPKTKGDAPQIEATVIGAANLPPDKFFLVDKLSKPPFEVKATSKRGFLQGSETLAVAIVMLGWEQWIGNTSYIPEDDPSRMEGVLKPLKEAMTSLKFKEAGPPGSVGMVITYGTTATIKHQMQPLEKLTAEALGNEKDYGGDAAFELVKGIELALTELNKVPNPTKVLIIITDGNDSSKAAEAKARLQELKKQAKSSRVQVEAIIYKAKDSGENNYLLGVFSSTTASTVGQIAVLLNGVLQRIANRQYLTFPGYNKETKLGFKWDGKEHELTFKIDKDEIDTQPVTLAPVWNPPKEGSFPWLIVILVVVVVLLLIIVAVKVFSKKEPAPVLMPQMPQMPMQVGPAPPPEAPKPLGPVKTVMIGQGGDEGGFPVVGWLVPLNGQHAYQTFRLRGGGTKIGTAPPADIVVNDGFMSTHHCDIHCSPTGFSLVDPGSTNGCYVNDKRVQKHDLVDNDMITLGKTNFKFKSIV
jgi:hypothetical protein